MRPTTFARGLLCTLATAAGSLLLPAAAQAAEPGQIVIEKTDQFADPVAGAVFEALLSDGDGRFEPDAGDGDAKAAECTSDAAGRCVLGPVAPGGYFVRELSAPTGYTGDERVRGPIAIAEGATVVIDRATDLDGDGVSDGFLNVRQVPVGTLTVSVEGGDPTFVLDPAEIPPFELDEGESATFGVIPAGFYNLRMTRLDNDLEFDAIDCGGDEIDVNLANRSVNFAITGGDTVACTFVVSDDDVDSYDSYDDDPGDSGFDFATPFTDAGDAAATPGDSGDGGSGSRELQPSGEELVVAGTGPGVSGAAVESGPGVLSELPRTGTAVGDLTMVGALLLALGTVAVLARPRRGTPHRP